MVACHVISLAAEQASRERQLALGVALLQGWESGRGGGGRGGREKGSEAEVSGREGE